MRFGGLPKELLFVAFTDGAVYFNALYKDLLERGRQEWQKDTLEKSDQMSLNSSTTCQQKEVGANAKA